METILTIVLAILVGAMVIVFGIFFMALNYAKQEARRIEHDNKR
jgi:vacuolar-type H+-ATPase subunit I/STV1